MHLGQGATHHLFCRPAEHPLGSGVPRHHVSLQVESGDGVASLAYELLVQDLHFAGSLFGPLALGDVKGKAADPCERALVVTERDDNIVHPPQSAVFVANSTLEGG